MSICTIEEITRETASPKWFQLYVLRDRELAKNFVGSKAASTDAMTITQFIAGQYDLSVNWRDVEWFKSIWGGPVLRKGILTAEDARLAAEHGADGVIVSNHGGRQLEGAISAVQALLEIAQAVGDKLCRVKPRGLRIPASRSGKLAREVLLPKRYSDWPQSCLRMPGKYGK